MFIAALPATAKIQAVQIAFIPNGVCLGGSTPPGCGEASDSNVSQCQRMNKQLKNK